MVRLALLAVITLSCSSAGALPPYVDGAVEHDSHRVDSPIADHDATIEPTVDAGFACKPANIFHGDGKHNPGMDCMSNCHNHGFSVAGTVYVANGTTPATNATVTVVDANGGTQDVIVSSNGNFFSFIPVAYPITVRASLCPSVQVMVGTATAGSCNAGGCHDPGGLQGVTHL